MNILMPQLGETVAEGKITAWFKTIGDAVKPGDNLFEIETDKTSMEVPATTAGVLSEIRVPAGTIAPVGAVVAVLAEAGLSYLGFGAPITEPSWGVLLAQLQQYISVYPLSVLWPGLAITLTVLCVNFMGDALRDALDPRRRG